MWDFSIGKSLSMVARSWPFVLLRAAVYSLATIGYLILIAIGGGVGYGLGHISSNADSSTAYAVGGGAAGLALAAFLFRLFAEYILYVVKAGHIAVLVRLMDSKEVPGAFEQIDYGRKIVTERFAEANVLFVMDQLIKAVVRTISALFRTIGAFLPIPGLQGLISFINAVITLSLTYADEVILAYNIRSGTNNPWETSRRALVLYSQNSKNIMKNAFWLAIFLWVAALVVFLLMLSPAAALVYWMPGEMAGWSFVLAIVMTWAILASIVEPFAISSLMQVYFKAIQGQTPDPSWDATLAEKSAQFRELKEKAMSSFGDPEKTRIPVGR